MSEVDAFRRAAVAWAVRGNEDAGAVAAVLAPDIDAAILVEGVSDAAALEALARLTGRSLERVCVIPLGGVTNVAKFVGALAPLGIRLAGLCDFGEQGYFERVMAPTDFFVCADDLEAELIRALGTARVLEVLDANGDLRGFRTFQNQPAQRGRPLDRQLRRFFGTTSGRKERYATVLVDALEAVPQPLEDLLRFATRD
jgi:hypothetical protein